jgi:hypothetical protein
MASAIMIPIARPVHDHEGRLVARSALSGRQRQVTTPANPASAGGARSRSVCQVMPASSSVRKRAAAPGARHLSVGATTPGRFAMPPRGIVGLTPKRAATQVRQEPRRGGNPRTLRISRMPPAPRRSVDTLHGRSDTSGRQSPFRAGLHITLRPLAPAVMLIPDHVRHLDQTDPPDPLEEERRLVQGSRKWARTPPHGCSRVAR